MLNGNRRIHFVLTKKVKAAKLCSHLIRTEIIDRTKINRFRGRKEHAMNKKTGIIAGIVATGVLCLTVGIFIGNKMASDYHSGLDDSRKKALEELAKSYDEPSTQTIKLHPNETQF